VQLHPGMVKLEIAEDLPESWQLL